jgi:hypothetical protein
MGPSQPIWFDPTLFGGTRRYVGAVWLAGAVPVMIVGAALAGPIGAVVAAVLWGMACLGVAAAWTRARGHWFAATRSPVTCASCGTSTFTDPCPACGARIDRVGHGPTHGADVDR